MRRPDFHTFIPGYGLWILETIGGEHERLSRKVMAV